MGFLSYGYKALKGSGQAINKVKPTVNKTKLEKKLSETTKAIQKAKGSGAKLSQSIFELKNNLPITFKNNKTKTLSNTELKKKADAIKKDKKTTKIFNAPENFNKGGRVGRRLGGGADMAKKKTNIQKIRETFAPKNKNLKPVDKKKQKGLAKLPIEVRNKMGYAKKGGRA
tara:strand:- start:5 stop:517 length:513 start_codon:yes stop_codon:yes gene_type:complete